MHRLPSQVPIKIHPARCLLELLNRILRTKIRVRQQYPLIYGTPLTERICGAIARLRPSSTATPKTHSKADPAQKTVPRRKSKPRRRSLHRKEGCPQSHDNRHLQHGFQRKSAIGRVKPATGYPSENQAKEQSTHGHDATLQKPCAHLLLPSPPMAEP